MKKGMILSALLMIALTGCQVNITGNSGKTSQAGSEIPESKTVLISNMADKKSEDEVMGILKENIPEKNVDKFREYVDDFNNTVKKTGMTDGFVNKMPVYEMDRISELWKGAKGDFIGTNCRINTYTLLKDSIKSVKSASDDKLLFLDNDAISYGRLFSEADTETFRQLFSRVKTEKTKDVKIHAEKMKEHFSKFTFSDKARMVSVIIHDNLDGDYLFVGHVGVLTEYKDGFLFVEKLSFDEPYQALKFSSEKECYRYLEEKYKDYQDEGTARPFVMVNGEKADI